MNFKAHALPIPLQWSSIHAGLVENNQVLIGGNFYDCNIEMGRYDASYGNILTIGKDGKMNYSDIGGIQLQGQVKSIQRITIKGKPCFIFAKNDDYLQVLSGK